ncbi:MAG: leucyl aminopeptidase [Candidatus Komeilibacteria bacterium]
MELITYAKKVGPAKADVFFYPVLQNDQEILKLIKSFGYADEEVILARLKRENFHGKKGQFFLIHSEDVAMVILGTGQKKKMLAEDWREAAGKLVQYLSKYEANNIGIVLSSWLKGNNDVYRLGVSLAEGIMLASYRFDKYLNDDEDDIKIDIDKFIVYLTAAQRVKFKKGWEQGLMMAMGTIKARDLVNEPAGLMTPAFLAKEALKIAKDNKQVSVKILEKADVKKLKMGAFMGVDQGSEEPLKFIHLVYKPKGKAKDKVAIVGKGITFDSGGLNIKVGDGMTQMKVDMAGAASVLGIFSAINDLSPKVEVHGIIAACENMPSGKAYKPGDVLTNMQGKTIEIGNTDAEGRVTLADSLAYAQKQGIKTIVDMATLTGACMIALGTDYTALYANNDKFAKELSKCADITGEKVWHMPLVSEYKKLNESKIANVRNVANTRYGGSITAALFLQEFIEEGVTWSHWDIAGPAFAEKPFNSYTPVGGVGHGVRTLLTWLLDY